jgi:hypothetical protein
VSPRCAAYNARDSATPRSAMEDTNEASRFIEMGEIGGLEDVGIIA